MAEGPERPAVRRRATLRAAPGYGGHKRGEVVRTREVVQQAHSREWLGSFGAAGNGQRWPRLERALDAIVGYLRAHAIAPQDGIARMDGEFGWAHAAVLLAQRGLGYLMRCADYRLLDAPEVREALTRAPVRFAQIDTGTVRDVYDVGWVAWSSEKDASMSVWTRLVVTSQVTSPDAKVRIGKRVGDRVFELFVTDQSPEALTALDVLSLYFARGGFEQTLSEEDRETDPDRWVSAHPHGQELGEILAQWVWNLRLQLGLSIDQRPARCTLWAEAQPSSATSPPTTPAPHQPPEPADATPPSPAEIAPSTLNAASAEPVLLPAEPSSVAPLPREDAPAGSLAGPSRSGFVLQPDGTLRCPASKVLRRTETRLTVVRFGARLSDCRACAQSSTCFRGGVVHQNGRRVDWPRAELPDASAPPVPRTSAKPAPRLAVRPLNVPLAPRPSAGSPGPHPVLWYDLPATGLRRLLSQRLRQQRIDGLTAASDARLSPPPEQPQSRDQRAHRRLTWSERLARNARSANAPPVRLRVYGIPAAVAATLGLLTTG